jgi:hypothetical protein
VYCGLKAKKREIEAESVAVWLVGRLPASYYHDCGYGYDYDYAREKGKNLTGRADGATIIRACQESVGID